MKNVPVILPPKPPERQSEQAARKSLFHRRTRTLFLLKQIRKPETESSSFFAHRMIDSTRTGSEKLGNVTQSVGREICSCRILRLPSESRMTTCVTRALDKCFSPWLVPAASLTTLFSASN